jgi:hypothetical protein
MVFLCSLYSKTLEKLYLLMILLIASNLEISVKTVTKNKFIRLNINW